MSLKLIILGKSGLQVLTEVFKVNQYFKKKDHGICLVPSLHGK